MFRPALLARTAPALLASVLLLSGCGGGSAPAPTPTPNPNPAPGNGGTLTRAQIATCPNVSGSADLGASACLRGTVVGKTLGGDPCTLTVKDSGSYAYAGKNLNYSYANAVGHFNFFAYAPSIDFLLWDTHTPDYTVNLEVRYNDQQTGRMQINVENNRVTETCVAQL